jgi:hypothetical protein
MLVVCCGLTLLQTGCLVNTEITLKQDGSARVITSLETDPDSSSSSYTTDEQIIAYQDSFFKSSQISGFSLLTGSDNVTFNIKTIDSLGNYLYSGFNKNYFQFNYSGDTLTFTDGNGPAFKDKHHYRNYQCCTFEIKITSDRKIKSIQLNDRFIKPKNNTILIKKSHRQFKKKKKDIRLVIVFEK